MGKYLSQVEIKRLTNGADTAHNQAEYLRTHYGIEPFVVGGRVLVYEEVAIRAQLTPRSERSSVAVNVGVFNGKAAQTR